MILDKNLVFVKGTDPAAATTRAIPLGQSENYPAPTEEMGVYNALWLVVSAADVVTGMKVTLETSDTETGTFTPVKSYPAVSGGAGTLIVKDPLPMNLKNWIRLTFSAAVAMNAEVVVDTPTGKFPKFV